MFDLYVTPAATATSRQVWGIKWDDVGYEHDVEPAGKWLERKGAKVWTGEPGVRLCQFDNHAGIFFCPKGPGCEYCAEGDGGLAPTITPGSPWERSDDEDWAGPPVPSVIPRKLDYWALPTNLLAQLDMAECPFNAVEEVERAKRHPEFTKFMEWYIAKYGPEDHVYGNPEEDPVEELLGFTTWLVETGRGDFMESPQEEPGLHLSLNRRQKYCLILLYCIPSTPKAHISLPYVAYK